MKTKLGKNARKKRLRRQIAEFDRWEMNGRAPSTSAVSKRHAQAHELSRRHRWLGAGKKDGCPHPARTFIPAGKMATRPAPFLKYQRAD